jgi:hypothetical protein
VLAQQQKQDFETFNTGSILGETPILILTIALIMLLLLWAGMMLGISFLESWVKFRAPGLTKPVALSVGRTVFKAFHYAQTYFLLLIICISLFAGINELKWGLTIALALIYSIQTWVVMPYLDRRVSLILAGKELKKSQMHTVYGLMEMAKLILLLWLAIYSMLSL